MRLIHSLISVIAALWARWRFRCQHQFDDRCVPPACIYCGITATPSPDWGC